MADNESRGGHRVVTVTFTEESFAQVEDLRQQLEVDGYLSVFRMALGLLFKFLKWRREGYEIALIRGDEPVRIIDINFSD